MRLYRANYSLVARDGRVKVDEQWVFFEAKTYSDALEKIPGLLKAMWDCSEFQLEVWGLMPDNQIVDISMDMDIDSPRDWRFLVSPSWLARLNKALVECRSAGGQHE
ncbi:hypothetical protein LFZ91_12655 [Salmonella enterica subsp. enterica serovar Hillingdon]|nr:hypothetical protein [Salmonella enterica]KSB23264.1 hypothetical protein LFZ91_12655 [Salmonella enterica subsp. enterica serovar Hillingdon]